MIIKNIKLTSAFLDEFEGQENELKETEGKVVAVKNNKNKKNDNETYNNFWEKI